MGLVNIHKPPEKQCFDLIVVQTGTCQQMCHIVPHPASVFKGINRS